MRFVLSFAVLLSSWIVVQASLLASFPSLEDSKYPSGFDPTPFVPRERFDEVREAFRITPVEDAHQMRCDPDQDRSKLMKWVPLDAIVVPQLGARTTHGKGGFTIFGNIQAAPDPRKLPCIVVCMMDIVEKRRGVEDQTAKKYRRYWSEATRRVVMWRLGGLPAKFKNHVPVQMTNCDEPTVPTPPDDALHSFRMISHKDWAKGISNPAIAKMPHYLEAFGWDTFFRFRTPIVLYAEEAATNTQFWEVLSYAKLINWVESRPDKEELMYTTLPNGSRMRWLLYAGEENMPFLQTNGFCNAHGPHRPGRVPPDEFPFHPGFVHQLEEILQGGIHPVFTPPPVAQPGEGVSEKDLHRIRFAEIVAAQRQAWERAVAKIPVDSLPGLCKKKKLNKPLVRTAKLLRTAIAGDVPEDYAYVGEKEKNDQMFAWLRAFQTFHPIGSVFPRVSSTSGTVVELSPRPSAAREDCDYRENVFLPLDPVGFFSPSPEQSGVEKFSVPHRPGEAKAPIRLTIKFRESDGWFPRQEVVSIYNPKKALPELLRPVPSSTQRAWTTPFAWKREQFLGKASAAAGVSGSAPTRWCVFDVEKGKFLQDHMEDFVRGAAGGVVCVWPEVAAQAGLMEVQAPGDDVVGHTCCYQHAILDQGQCAPWCYEDVGP